MISVFEKIRKISSLVIVLIIFLSLWINNSDSEENTSSTSIKEQTGDSIEPSVFSLSISTGLFSKYIWRGQLINDEFVFQPDVSLSYKGLTASLWTNIDLSDQNGNNGEFTEYDWTLLYEGNLLIYKTIKYSIGAIYYAFPKNIPDTTELFGSLGINIFLNPKINIYRDIDEYDGTYASFGLIHEFEKIFELNSNTHIGLTLYGNIGWGDKRYNKTYWSGYQDNAFNDLLFGASFPVKIGKWAINPSVNSVFLLDDKICDADTYSTKNNYLLFSLEVSIDF